MTVQIRHFSSGEAHGVRHRRQQMADFSFARHGQQAGCPSFPSPGHFFVPAGWFQLHQMIAFTQFSDLFILRSLSEEVSSSGGVLPPAPCI